MSFLCENCNKISQPRTRQNRIIVEKRERTYYDIIIKHKIVKKERHLQFERKDINILKDLERQGWKVIHESFSKGTEIVNEKRICEECNIELEKKNDKRTNT